MKATNQLVKVHLIILLNLHAIFGNFNELQMTQFTSESSTPTTPAAVHTRTPAADPCADENQAQKSILATLMANYDKQNPPPGGKTPIVAEVEMHINDIPSLSELESEFSLDLMYSEMWADHRLSYANLPEGQCISNITLDLDYLKKVWSPNTCIVNSKSATIHSSPSENVFLILYQDGSIWKNCRMMVRAPCDIDLRNFPFDTQKCQMIFESYSYNSRKVQLQWYQNAPITLVKKMKLPDFTLTKWDVERNVMAYPNGHWDQLKATFTFKRRYGFFILQAYVPTYMTIFVAWINFWMDPKELSTRATLAISAFLAITLQFGNIIKNQPPVSYVKALDVWMLCCIIFLFSSLAELAVVSFMQRSDRPKNLGKKRRKHKSVSYAETLMRKNNNMILAKDFDLVHEDGSLATERDSFLENFKEVTRRKLSVLKLRRIVDVYDRLSPYGIDKFCLFCFPISFVVFNFFYWCYFVGFDNL